MPEHIRSVGVIRYWVEFYPSVSFQDWLYNFLVRRLFKLTGWCEIALITCFAEAIVFNGCVPMSVSQTTFIPLLANIRFIVPIVCSHFMNLFLSVVKFIDKFIYISDELVLVGLLQNIVTVITDLLVFGVCLWNIWGTWKLKREAGIQSSDDLVSIFLAQSMSQ